MAAVPVTMQVMIYPRNKTDPPYPATLVGYAWVTGLGVGGGPVVPPDLPPDKPPIFPSDGTPAHPICLPGMECWEGIIDPPPIDPPNPPTVGKPPPPDGGWGWHPDYGWGYFPGSAGKPQPPGRR